MKLWTQIKVLSILSSDSQQEKKREDFLLLWYYVQEAVNHITSCYNEKKNRPENAAQVADWINKT